MPSFYNPKESFLEQCSVAKCLKSLPSVLGVVKWKTQPLLASKYFSLKCLQYTCKGAHIWCHQNGLFFNLCRCQTATVIHMVSYPPAFSIFFCRYWTDCVLYESSCIRATHQKCYGTGICPITPIMESDFLNIAYRELCDCWERSTLKVY